MRVQPLSSLSSPTSVQSAFPLSPSSNHPPPPQQSSSLHAGSTPALATSSISPPLMSFYDFLENQQSTGTIFALYFWYIAVGVCTTIIKYFQLNDSQNKSSSPLTMLRFLGCIPILLHLHHFLQQKYFPSSKFPPFRIYQIGNMFLLITTFLSSSGLLIASISEKCEFALCEQVESRQLQPYLLLQHILIPIIAPVLVKAHSSWCAYLLFVISFSVSILSAILLHATIPAFFTIGILYLLEIIVVYDNESTLRQLYLNYLSCEEHLRMKLKTIHERELLLLRGEELSSFYGNVAHDLKSPLQGFTIELDTLENNVNDNQSVQSIVVLRSICSFMLMTINRAIDYSKASSGMLLVPTLEPVNICDAINWVVGCISPLNEISLKIEPFPEAMCVNIITDKHWFMENLLCLVSNALKFTVDGSINIRCLLQSNSLRSGLNEVDHTLSILPHSTKTSSDASMIVIFEVEDSGGETKTNELIDLFQPYRQSERREGGTGLGLYSILKRVEALGGSCGVTSRRDGGKGSRFWFSFPYQVHDPLPTSSPPPLLSSPRHDVELDVDLEGIRAPSPTTTDFHPEKTDEEEPISPTVLMKDSHRILLVEDSVLIQKTTSRALSKEGYIVDIARNGLECLTMVKNQDYAFILMDIQMPVMDGIEATKRLREMELERNREMKNRESEEKPTLYSQPHTHSFPRYDRLGEPNSTNEFSHIIIGLSANSDPTTMTEALNAGMNAFLAKPLSTKLLKETFIRLSLLRN